MELLNDVQHTCTVIQKFINFTYFITFTNTFTMIPDAVFFTNILFERIFTFTVTFIVVGFWFKLDASHLNPHLQSHETSFNDDLDSIIIAVILNSFMVTFSVLSGTHISLDMLSRLIAISTTSIYFNFK